MGQGAPGTAIAEAAGWAAAERDLVWEEKGGWEEA